MSCLTTSATRRSRSVPAAVLIASEAASSHDVVLVPMISVTLYTLITLSFDRCRPRRAACGQPFTGPPVRSSVQTGDHRDRRATRRLRHADEQLAVQDADPAVRVGRPL